MEKSNQNQDIDAGAAAAAVVAKNDSQAKPAPYLKLIGDCWEHIFDNLSFNDILKMGQTCQRMNRMAGFYIREYHPELEFSLIKEELHFQSVRLQPDFYPFVGQLWCNSTSDLDFLSNITTFDALKTIKFHECKLTEAQIEHMQNVLKNVESIELLKCELTVDIFEKMANYCPKLKEINIDYNMVLMYLNELMYQNEVMNSNCSLKRIRI